MKYGSVCSGIEAATCAWHTLGWEPQWFAEIEPFPSAVLKHHYPEVPNLGDFTKIGVDYEPPGEPIDVLVGGTPCQSFSVAGKRAGLDDARGNLAIEFLRLAQRLRPTWILFENVPGLLSSEQGRDFRYFLDMVGECGYGWSYRVLDAQFFGVPQRRRRVFLVGYLGAWQPACAVLSQFQGLQGNPAPRRETREGLTRGFEIGPGNNGFTDIAPTVDTRSRNGPMQNQIGLCDTQPYTPSSHADNQHGVGTLRSNGGDSGGGSETLLVGMGATASGMRDVSTSLSTSQQRIDAETETFVVTHALTARYDSSEGGCGRGVPLTVAFQQNTRDEVRLMGGDGSIAGSLSAEAGMHQQNYVADVTGTLTGWDNQRQRIHDEQGIAPTFSNNSGGGGNEVFSVKQGMQVRRLTPTECERLQGFKDGYTLVPFRGKPAADGNRYRALGNSFAVPVVHWIGRRIDMVDRLLKEIA